MGFLDRFFGNAGNRGIASDDRVVMAIDAASLDAAGRRRKIEVVGERFRQQALVAIAGRKGDDPVNMPHTAALVPEPTNKHDANAVQVIIDGRHVGYLSREQAVGYHNMMASVEHPGRALANIEARIYGGRISDDGYVNNYEVCIYLPASLANQIGFLQWQSGGSASIEVVIE